MKYENILFSKESCLKPLAIPLRGILPVSARRDRKHTVFEGETSEADSVFDIIYAVIRRKLDDCSG